MVSRPPGLLFSLLVAQIVFTQEKKTKTKRIESLFKRTCLPRVIPISSSSSIGLTPFVLPILVSSRLSVAFPPLTTCPTSKSQCSHPFFFNRNYSWQPLSLHSISSFADSFLLPIFTVTVVPFARHAPVHYPPSPSTFSYLLHSVPPIVPTFRGLSSAIRRSPHIQVSIYALTSPPHTRSKRPILLGKELLIGTNTSLPDPLFRHFFVVNAFSICMHLTNVRLTHIHHWLPQACLPPSRSFL